MRLNKGDEVKFPTKFGQFRLIPYSEGEKCHMALVAGNPEDGALVRIHSECLTGEALFSLRCDCREQLERSMQIIAEGRNGVLIYLRQEGRGIGLLNKMKAYSLQDKGMDTVEANHQLGFRADERDYSAAVAILKDLGLKKIRLITNNPEKIKGLNGSIEVSERIPIVVQPNGHNKRYLDAKREKMGHEI
ncbi:GTP cyclohydrolase II [Candidatus Woesearchaeota archaeon CG10_big_fil_rev_8_21_14_0_10_44_13]|nr:MAG: GTP cyclohydrolase II [Candidatus Woesearchaeota archaeon CG10_big_fil_rev_8_21_14_0_10_44_13]